MYVRVEHEAEIGSRRRVLKVFNDCTDCCVVHETFSEVRYDRGQPSEHTARQKSPVSDYIDVS